MKIKFFTFFFIILFSFSCGKNIRTHRNDDVIPQKTFTQILIQIHLADAILSKQNLSDSKLNMDSASYYNQIFKKYKINREQFYFSLKYYVQHINKFIAIQNVVIDSLKNRFDYLDSIERIGLKKHDLWELKRNWKFPEDAIKSTIPYSIITDKVGTYTLISNIYIFPDDLSQNLKMKITAYYYDKTFDNKEISISGKKETWKEYNVSVVSNPNKKLIKIGGELLSNGNNTTYMHLEVKDILINFKAIKKIEPDSTKTKD